MRSIIALLLLASSSLQAHETGPIEGHGSGRIDCQQYMADEFGCLRVDMLSHLSIDNLAGGVSANDLWGWTDSLTKREYVLIGTFLGTVFVDISNPETPIRLGFLAAHEEQTCRHSQTGDTGGCGAGSVWRDIKVYADHAFIVSESDGHGMQVFDLAQLRNGIVAQNYIESAWYGGFGAAHNIAINNDTGYAYVVGSATYLGGPHFIDIRTPTDPRGAGGFGGDGYSHDAQCVIYNGPDADYTGSEVCFLSNEDTVTIVDVADKNNPVMLSRSGYTGARYTHQGWIDESHTWMYVNDEADETQLGGQTYTYIWNLSNLDAPVLANIYRGMIESIDHNNYVRGHYLYQSNYTTGLRILDISTPDLPLEVAWFDSFPTDDLATYDGSWSNFPYFDSGVIALSDADNGLFLLRPTLSPDLPVGDLTVEIANLSQPDTTRFLFQLDATISNSGLDTLDDVVATIVLDPTITTFTTTGGSCQRRGRFADCAIGPLGAGDTASLRITLNATTGGQKSNQIQVTARNTDPDTRNNKASRNLTLLPLAPAPAPTPAPAPAPPGGGGGGGAFIWGLLGALATALLRQLRFNSGQKTIVG